MNLNSQSFLSIIISLLIVCIIFLWFRNSKSNSSDPSKRKSAIEELQKLENNSLKKDIENKDNLFQQEISNKKNLMQEKERILILC